MSYLSVVIVRHDLKMSPVQPYVSVPFTDTSLTLCQLHIPLLPEGQSLDSSPFCTFSLTFLTCGVPVNPEPNATTKTSTTANPFQLVSRCLCGGWCETSCLRLLFLSQSHHFCPCNTCNSHCPSSPSTAGAEVLQLDGNLLHLRCFPFFLVAPSFYISCSLCLSISKPGRSLFNRPPHLSCPTESQHFLQHIHSLFFAHTDLCCTLICSLKSLLENNMMPTS